MTEAASGAFVTTSLIAAMAGATVKAVTRNSSYGSADEVAEYTRQWAANMGVESLISVSTDAPSELAAGTDIVTNLGFVRPVNSDLVNRLPPHAVVALMWEPWEFREGDIDINACVAKGIPVIGTNETDCRLNTFKHVGTLAAKLLLEQQIEIFASKIAVIGSEPFKSAAADLLAAMGAETFVLDLPENPELDLDSMHGDRVEKSDALVLVEHRDPRQLIGKETGIRPERFLRSGAKLIHVCGSVDASAFAGFAAPKWPLRNAAFGTMTVTTDYIGPKPVIDLHCAGLKVAEAAVRVKMAGGTNRDAVFAAEATGLGLRLEIPGFQT